MVLLLPLAKDPCVFSPLSTGFGLLPILGNGLLLAFRTLSALLVVGAILLKPDTLQLLRLESPSLGLLTVMYISLLLMLFMSLIPLIEVFLTAYFVTWEHTLPGEHDIYCYLPWCNYLHAADGVQPQLFADSLECVTQDPEQLLRAARFFTRYIRLVGQQPAPSKCVFVTIGDMRNWIISDEVKNGLLSWMYVTWGGPCRLYPTSPSFHTWEPSCEIVK